MWAHSLDWEDPLEEEMATHSIFFFFFFKMAIIFFYFLNYESMITHLQETWKMQHKVTYSSTIYYNYFFSRLRFLVGVSISNLKN